VSAISAVPGGGAMTAGRTMFEKIWSRHVVAEGPGGQTLLYIDRHLLHEGSTQAFARLARAGRRPLRPEAMFATADHYVPTTDRSALCLRLQRELQRAELGADSRGKGGTRGRSADGGR